MRIWTMGYFPLILGGNVWQPICIETEVIGPFELGEGYKGFVATAPNGKTFVAEERSGGLVGPDIKTVREDINTGDKSIMEQQVLDSIEKGKNARELKPEEFWELLNCNK